MPSQIKLTLTKPLACNLVLKSMFLVPESEQIKPTLPYIQGLIEGFETRHGDMESTVTGKQWVLLKAALVTHAESIRFQEDAPALHTRTSADSMN